MIWVAYVGGGVLVLWIAFAAWRAHKARLKALAYQREQWDEEYKRLHTSKWPRPPKAPSFESIPTGVHRSTRTRKHTSTTLAEPLTPSDPVPWPTFTSPSETPAAIDTSGESERVFSGGGGHSGGAGASGSWDSGSSDSGCSSSSDSGGSSSDSGGSDSGGSCGSND